MDGQLRDGEIRVGEDARQRFYDSRGYGRPVGGNEIALSWVEAGHLLFRGDLDTVDGMDFREFTTEAETEFGTKFLVYADLRDRGFYLSPDREGWVDEPRDDTDFVVYPRGKGPTDAAEPEYRVRVLGERGAVGVSQLGDVVLAVVDEEGDLTYFETGHYDPTGETEYTPETTVDATLLDDRLVVWGSAGDLHRLGFYGQPLTGRAADYDAIHLSLVEGAYLAATGALTLGHASDDAFEAIVERGRAVEGERFDRRLRVYRDLRDAGSVPKTGFKFGADFRVYADVESVEDLGHSEALVRALPGGYTFDPRDLALDVRLAGGVRKKMVFAFEPTTDQTDTLDWVYASRLTP
ncbi:tRNA-intron lyase [Halospeciosus flavus]|uniref:tRNA-splicing endonuclease n=1 Tax=Halospeciosus flavus TaxID=3032283 RepID=A0ABD5Z6U9_9EURY|nr:tRNA-intron lyase [Halospeciosus flavus]